MSNTGHRVPKRPLITTRLCMKQENGLYVPNVVQSCRIGERRSHHSHHEDDIYGDGHGISHYNNSTLSNQRRHHQCEPPDLTSSSNHHNQMESEYDGLNQYEHIGDHISDSSTVSTGLPHLSGPSSASGGKMSSSYATSSSVHKRSREFDTGLMLFSSQPTLLAGNICVPPDGTLRGQQSGYPVLHQKSPFYPSDSRKKLPFSLNWKSFAIGFLILGLVLIITMTCIMALKSDSDSHSENSRNKNKVSESSKPMERLPDRGSPFRHEAEDRGFDEAVLGQKLTYQVPSYGHWSVQLNRNEASLIKFSFIIPFGSSIGIYAGKNRAPTHTKYEFMQVIGDDTLNRPIRSSNSSNGGVMSSQYSGHKVRNAEFTKFLDKGIWYISIFNDAPNPSEVSFIMVTTDDTNVRCPYDCSGHGTCVMGTCKCDQDYAGENCELRVCPQLCSGRGQYAKGNCLCNSGWKGKECELREDECEVSDCSGHGDCSDGQCQCFPGYKGNSCEEVDCLDPDCNGHGVCVKGLCMCGKGWKGADCSEPEASCLPECSKHGTFNLETSQCICEPGWMGDDCSKEKCDMECGHNGHCEGGECVCSAGWGGLRCEERLCDTRCLEHGQCKNGTCLCMQGWNGKHCTLEGCPRQCNNHGVCIQKDDNWQCACNSDWDGYDCSIPLEKECSDKKDNDHDGLIDCADSECCSSKDCQEHQLCQKSADPLDILLRKSPPSPTASFFQRMQFLIEEESVQNYAQRKAFNDSRASVIRGQVTSPSGHGLVGVRVGVVGENHLGFVLTREGGYFDIMVNGGLAVTLSFYRDPFPRNQRTIMVPWNQIVVMDKVVLAMDESKLIAKPWSHSICVEHDYELVRPIILATGKHVPPGNCTRRTGPYAEVVKESVKIPSANINLVYHSSRASGFYSIMELQLTPDRVPDGLRFVHLKISLEGNFEERVFEADPNIRYTYSWNRRNVYRQNVFGMATAMVHVGYDYVNCPQIIWDVQTVQLSGHDMSISDIGGWNLDVHHRYNFHEGILQRGDGTNIYLKNKPRMMMNIMGDGHQRPLNCAYCNGPAREQRLLAPVALASGADGSIYVGDFNLIRRISPDGMVNTIVELSASQVAYRYHLAMGLSDNKLYMSDPERHQILRVINTTDPMNPRENVQVVVGSGLKCLPGDKSACGDERPARDARLAYPKGVAVSLNGEIYIADGTNIRYVDTNGIIHTIIGDHFHKLHWKPFPCTGTVPTQKYNLRWPTELAINPIDNSLHILDDHMVLKLMPDKRLRIIAGRPTHCSSVITAQEDPAKEPETLLGSQVFLETPQSIAFSSNGNLYIAESDSQMVNRVRLIQQDGRISRFAGMDLKCSCMESNCECFNQEVSLASHSKMSAIASITVTADGNVHICDQGNVRLRSVISSIPQPDGNGDYEISSPETQELYLFNRFGHHVTTKGLATRQTLYTFSYDVNTSFGKLIFVTDVHGDKIQLLRDFTKHVKTIESSKGGKCHIQVSGRTKMIQAIKLPNGQHYNFEYFGSSGLLRSRTDSMGHSIIYEYDQYGRLAQAFQPNGDTVTLRYDSNSDGLTEKVSSASNRRSHQKSSRPSSGEWRHYQRKGSPIC